MKLFTVILLCILAGAEVDLFVPSFPNLQKIFNLSPFMVQLTLSSNFIAYCVSSFFVGSFGDKYGIRVTILSGLVVFIIGSIACSFAPNYLWIVIGRFLQGLGIAAPATLAYVVIAEEYSVEKQQSMMGLINGVITLSMALAPVVGSYINKSFNWQGNFLLLLGFGVTCFLLAYKFLDKKITNTKKQAESISYYSLFTSNKIIIFVTAICALIIPYWVFIGISPILYMEGFGVPLEHFGYYQGALATVFGTVSLLSGRLFKLFGQKTCFYAGCFLCGLSGCLILMAGILNITNPFHLTCIMAILSAGAIFPVNILYPVALEIIAGAKGRIAAIIVAIRLICTAIGVQLVGYYYDGNFLNVSIIMFICLSIFGLATIKLASRDWLLLKDKAVQ